MESILVVEDDNTLRERIALALAKRHFTVYTASSGEEALQVAMRETKINRALVDLKLSDCSGLSLIAPLLDSWSEMKIVVLTGYGSIATAMEAVRLGALHYLTKPIELDEVLRAFEGEIDRSTLAAHYEPPSLSRAEWEHIQRVLLECSGNITLTAKLLGIPRRTLQRKLTKYPPPR